MKNTSGNRYALRDKFYSILKSRPLAQKAIFRLREEGDLLLFGGAVREFFNSDFEVIPRDFDIVVNSTNKDFERFFRGIPYKKNRFDGYKLNVDGLIFDIWGLSSTWAFKEKKVSDVRKENLPKTVFLNYDSVVYNLRTGDLYDEGYINAKKDKILDIVLEENPFPELNILRSFVFNKRDQMSYSDCLISYISDWCRKNNGHEVELLLNAQSKHYGKEYITQSEIEKELSVF
ncbi:hypothetical protein E4K67_15075 [Desulfosporosinus fructosivorans]|uniref:Poly A polymerase head domain-containing protein n=1 Tax=Desulfosporosinus fructosivorans TaxID=2018669 RepID=A0A4Z0R3N7_9FIRM|nr:hypothetical protein [Desulfosporosinus fructosivorans]TGE37194.1 hypothetical protein E4K67_15075 [Desulfosporosinus fructosivorans]